MKIFLFALLLIQYQMLKKKEKTTTMTTKKKWKQFPLTTTIRWHSNCDLHLCIYFKFQIRSIEWWFTWTELMTENKGDDTFVLLSYKRNFCNSKKIISQMTNDYMVIVMITKTTTTNDHHDKMHPFNRWWWWLCVLSTNH